MRMMMRRPIRFHSRTSYSNATPSGSFSSNHLSQPEIEAASSAWPSPFITFATNQSLRLISAIPSRARGGMVIPGASLYRSRAGPPKLNGRLIRTLAGD
jgi:hypothetical protein